jgi:hypothetical protein
MHAEIDPDGVRCQENVCCHDGMEFVSNGWIVFRCETGEGGTGFVLHIAAEAVVAALDEEYAAANQTYVGRELGRLEQQRCASEPARVAR